MIVRDASEGDREAWFRLWRDYCATYPGGAVSDAVTDETWRRILEPAQPIYSLLLCTAGEDGTAVAGFAHYVLHPNSWTDRLSCYMEDLYVAPEARRRGFAATLIEALAARGREQGWHVLYWVAAEGNAPARRLYERVARRTDFVRYDIPLCGEGER
jgi:ribosomal protein S18 acetylase RimI-like enzyme